MLKYVVPGTTKPFIYQTVYYSLSYVKLMEIMASREMQYGFQHGCQSEISFINYLRFASIERVLSMQYF